MIPSTDQIQSAVTTCYFTLIKQKKAFISGFISKFYAVLNLFLKNQVKTLQIVSSQ